MVKPVEELVSEQDPTKYKTLVLANIMLNYISCGDFSK
jgi:hypothetical protein